MHSKFGCTIMLIPYFCISVGYHSYSLHNLLCIRKVNIMVILTNKIIVFANTTKVFCSVFAYCKRSKLEPGKAWEQGYM